MCQIMFLMYDLCPIVHEGSIGIKAAVIILW